MKIKRFHKNWAKVQATHFQMAYILYSLRPRRDWTDGNENLNWNGTKSYYRGGGWWTIGGYSCDGRDLTEALDRLLQHKN